LFGLTASQECEVSAHAQLANLEEMRLALGSDDDFSGSLDDTDEEEQKDDSVLEEEKGEGEDQASGKGLVWTKEEFEQKKVALHEATIHCERRLGLCVGIRARNMYIDECEKTHNNDCKLWPQCLVETECDSLSQIATDIWQATPDLGSGKAANWSQFEWPTSENHVRGCLNSYRMMRMKLLQVEHPYHFDPLMRELSNIRSCIYLMYVVNANTGPKSAVWEAENPTLLEFQGFQADATDDMRDLMKTMNEDEEAS